MAGAASPSPALGEPTIRLAAGRVHAQDHALPHDSAGNAIAIATAKNFRDQFIRDNIVAQGFAQDLYAL